MTWLVFAMLVVIASPAWATERFVSPTGTGSTCSSGSPCSTATAIAASAGDDIITMQDGEYAGANYVLNLTGISGSSGHPITVRALNDGMVLVNGEFSRIPVRLNVSSWWVIEGINAKNGSGNVAQLNDSSNNIFRRVIMWDGNLTTNTHVFMFIDSSNNLVEDCAFFGAGRNVFHNFGNSDGNIGRRVWARWEGSTTVGGKLAIQADYAGHGLQCENCLGTWSAESMPSSYEQTDTAGAGNGTMRSSSFVEQNYSIYKSAANIGEAPGFAMYGSLAYMKTGEATGTANYPIVMIWYRYGNSQTVKHMMAFVPPSHTNFTNILGFGLGDSGDPCTSACTADHITSVRNADLEVSSAGGWTITNTSLGSSLAAVADPWTTTGAGANLCTRWVNGVVTTDPLWPWPMNQRIIDATTVAGSYSGPCVNCSGGRAARTATDVTADIEALLGTIPSACRTSPTNPAPGFPVVTDYPSISVTDTFDRADSATPGANWTNIEGSDFTISSNLMAAPVAFSRTLYTGSQATGSFHEVYATWTTAFPCCFDYSTMMSFAGTDISTNNQYRVQISRRTGGLSALMRVVKVDSVGGITVVGSAVDLGLDISDGNSFGIRTSGTTISVYWKWTDNQWYRVIETTDSGIPVSSNVYGGIAALSPAKLNDFAVGPAPGTTPSPPNPSAPCCGGEVGRFGTTFPGVR